MSFVCSICAEESTRICARCTKDACNNHLCEKCLRCSDCCECEVTLALADAGLGPPVGSARSVFRAPEIVTAPLPDPVADPALPPPDPEPALPLPAPIDQSLPEPVPEPPPAPDPDPMPVDESQPDPVEP